MNTPIIFRVLESEECAGILSPYILSSEIVDFMKTFHTKNKKLLDMINASPNEVLRGSVLRAYKKLPYESIIESSYTGNSNPYGDPVISGAQASGNANSIRTELMPHIVYEDSTNTKWYGSAIYNPCLRDSSDPVGGFPTGNYPEKVQNYTTSQTNNSVVGNGSETYSSNMGCCCNHKEGFVVNKLLTSITTTSLSAIVEIQIENILSALLQADRIPVKQPIIHGLRAILQTIANISRKDSSFLTDIYRFGLYTEPTRSILNPETAYCLKVRPFICVSDRGMDYVRTELFSVLKSYTDTTEISVLSQDQFINIQRTCPINLDFECELSRGTESSEFNLTFTDINKFRPDVVIGLEFPACIQPLLPGNRIAVPYGSSGTLSFILNRGGNRDYDIDGIVLNGRYYTIGELVKEDNNIGGYGLTGLTATLVEVRNSSTLFKLNYIGLSSNITISIRTLFVLDRMECEIDDLEVTHTLLSTLVIKNSFNMEDITINNAQCILTSGIEESENLDTNEDESLEVETTPSEPENAETEYRLEVSVPFTTEIKGIRFSNYIVIHKVLRCFDTNGNCTKCNYEDVTDSFIMMTSVNGSSLLPCNKLIFTTWLKDASEYIITFRKGALLTTLRVLTESLPATNSEDKLHFAINPVEDEFVLLEDTIEDYPEWLKPSLPESEDTPTEEPEQPPVEDTEEDPISEPEPSEEIPTIDTGSGTSDDSTITE